MPVQQQEACTVTVFRPQPPTELVSLVRAEFREMPGMRLTLEQAMRLWSLDRQTCEGVLCRLVDAHFLEQDLNGRFKRFHETY